jgi:hypothetical protein
MKKVKGSSGGVVGHGWINRWTSYVLTGVLFVSGAAAITHAGETAMTQQQYLQSMASICGDSLPPSATHADLIAWARGKGMNPAAGWNLQTNLTKEVMAQTLVQLLNFPRGSGKTDADAVRILERQGIVIPTTDGQVTARNFKRVIDSGLAFHSSLGRDGPHHNDEGPRPTETRPGHGHGDKNHEHTGPPGQVAKPPKKK